MNKIYLLFILLPLYLMTSCNDDAPCIYTNQNLQGTLLGEEWEFRNGQIWTIEDVTYVYLYGMDELEFPSDCGDPSSQYIGRSITFLLSDEGEYDIDDIPLMNVYNYTSEESRDIQSGCLNIVSVTDAEAVFKINFDENQNNVSGDFTIPICN